MVVKSTNLSVYILCTAVCSGWGTDKRVSLCAWEASRPVDTDEHKDTQREKWEGKTKYSMVGTCSTIFYFYFFVFLSIFFF